MTESERRAAIRTYIERDPFARHLGVAIDAIEPGYCRASLTVTEVMMNLHGTTHGGVLFTLADVALAAASNSRGQTAFALNVNIGFLTATAPGDRLIAEARETEASGPHAVYDLAVVRGDEAAPIARAQAIAYRRKQWFVPEG